MPRYIDAMSWMESIFGKEPDQPVVINQDQFNSFKQRYCPQGSTKPECVAIRGFSVPSAAPVASGAAATDDIMDSFKKMNMNELRVTTHIIAFKNDNGNVVHYPADKSKKEYKFGNFTIPTSSNVPIPGTLKVTFGMGPDCKRTDFALELRMSFPISPEFIACMNEMQEHELANITSITSLPSFFGKSELRITGNLVETRVESQISSFDLNGFVQNFIKQYEHCSDPATQLAELRVAGPADIAVVIKSKIAMIEKRLQKMSAEEKTIFEALKKQFASAGDNLELLNQISVGMDQLADARRARIYPAAVTASSIAGGKTRRKNRIRI